MIPEKAKSNVQQKNLCIWELETNDHHEIKLNQE